MSIFSFWSLKILLRSNMEIKSVHCGAAATLKGEELENCIICKKEKINSHSQFCL